MKPATTINELANNLLPIYFLTPEKDRDLYVPMYDEIIQTFRDSLIHDQFHSQTLYAGGQSGSGKSTAMNFLPNDEIAEKFIVLPVRAENLLDLYDVDIIDVLIMLAYELIKDEKKLENRFRKGLEKLRKKNQGILSEETERGKHHKLEGGGGINLKLEALEPFFKLFEFKTNFFANYRGNKEYRRITREAFEILKEDLLNLVNEIIGARLDLESSDKKLLLLISDLDHMKEPSQITDLFVNNRYYLESVQCKKVITVPSTLMANATFPSEIEYLGLKLGHNPNSPVRSKEAQEVITYNENLLRKVILNRIATNVNLITDEAITLAIEKSGGITRQFISILHGAATRVRRLKGSQISKEDVTFSVDHFRRTVLERAIIGKEKIDVLAKILTSYFPGQLENSTFLGLIIGNQIIAYHNDPIWYAINPIIENTVRIYANASRE